jgi:flotillin
VALIAWIVLAAVFVIAVIAFVQRFYRKSTRDVALLRTGSGGQRVALDGGFFALPILHRVDEVSMRAQRIVVERKSASGLLTEDRLRVDTTMEFRVRVAPEAASVAAAVQAFGARTLRSDDLGRFLEGRFVDAMQSHAATFALDDLHRRRAEFASAVRQAVTAELAEAGLKLEAVALIQFDQTPLAELNENNVFNAVGMRKLAEIVAENRKRRAVTESDAEMAVAQTRLATTKRLLEISRDEQEAQIGQQLALEQTRSQSEAEKASAREAAQQVADKARLVREQVHAAAEIEREQALERARMEGQLATELQRVSHAIDLAHRQEAEAQATIASERARTQLALAQEEGLAERELASQRRHRELALARTAQDGEVDAMKVKSASSRLLDTAQAEALAERSRVEAVQLRAAAEAQAQGARIAADNLQSTELIRMKLELARLEMLPALAEKVARPLEKIESIRINHLSGFGGGASAHPQGGGGPMDALYDMALQLPVLKRLGEAVGADLDLNIPQIARAQADHARAAADHAKSHPTPVKGTPS